MNYFQYLKWNKLTSKICTDDCCTCELKQQCDDVCDYIATSKLLKFIDTMWSFPHDVMYKIKQYRAKHVKKIYKCVVCGRMESPYFEEDLDYGDIVEDYGWCKLKHFYKYKEVDYALCHHCGSHGYCLNRESEQHLREYTWDEWHDRCVDHNRKLLQKIKKQDIDFWKKIKEHEHEALDR